MGGVRRDHGETAARTQQRCGAGEGEALIGDVLETADEQDGVEQAELRRLRLLDGKDGEPQPVVRSSRGGECPRACDHRRRDVDAGRFGDLRKQFEELLARAAADIEDPGASIEPAGAEQTARAPAADEADERAAAVPPMPALRFAVEGGAEIPG